MKNSIVSPATTTTNNASKTSKVSFADRLLMGEDIETIIEANQDLTVDYSEDLPTAETPLQPIESATERAEKVTQKSRLKAIFEDYQTREIPKEEWVRKATKDFPEFLKDRISKEFRYFNGAERPTYNSETIVSRTTLTVEQATEKANEMNEKAAIDAERIISEATAKAEKLISDTFTRANNFVELAKSNAERKAEMEAKIAAQSVKKAGEVLKTLESIDTSKVELTPEMREMMLRMLGMSATV